MDELDSAIVAELQRDARQTNRELARRLGASVSRCLGVSVSRCLGVSVSRCLGVSASTTLERVRALGRRGVLRGYHADVSLRALNRTVQALVTVQIRPLHRPVIDAFEEFAEGRPEVLSTFCLAGSDDVVLHVAVQDVERLHGFLIDHLSKRKEVAGFRTSVVYRHTRTPEVAALPE